MTNAEWCIKNGIQFKSLCCISSVDSKYEYIGYCDSSGNFNECYKGKYLGGLISERILTWLDMEHKEPILDNTERRYLSAVIRPFRDDVQYIMKLDGDFENFEEIMVGYKYKACDSADAFCYFDLPPFKKGTMYRGMKPNRKYTPEELGL